jgi:biotin carboxylase
MILGAGVMQGPAIRIAKELGFYTVVVDGSASAPCITYADKFEHIDLKEKEGIEALARSLLDSGLGGIMTAGTDFSATVAWVAEKLGLPGIPYEAALNASDKARMRTCFKKASLPSPEYVVITKEGSGEWGGGNAASGSGEERGKSPPSLQPSELPLPPSAGDTPATPPSPLSPPHSLLPTPHSPLVIKPVDNMGGRGCCRVDSMEEFQEAAADALRFSRSGRAIVEAFMEGPEFSVDAIVYHGEITICGLADRHIFFPPYFIEMGHTMPTEIAPEQQAMILETFCAGVRALGLADTHSIGAAKGDIKLTPQGPMIGEIAARLSGGYMSGWTYPYASGVEPVRAAILAAMGRKPDGLAPLKNWTSAERAFISIPGTVKSISGTEKARGLPHVQDLFFRTAEGDKVDFPRNNVSKCGNIISAAPNRAAAISAAESAAKTILIRLDPEDSRTAKFLSSPFLTQRHKGTKEEGKENADLTEYGVNPSSSLCASVPSCLGVVSSSTFPPDAFLLTDELKAALSALPETTTLQCGGAAPPLPTPHSPLPILPFPAFTSSDLRDYMGRTVTESLEAIQELTGFSFVFIETVPEIPSESGKSSDNIEESLQNPRGLGVSGFLGRSFWAALVRGGYQGAVYYIDKWGIKS